MDDHVTPLFGFGETVSGDSGNGGKREGDDSFHRMFGFAQWHCRLLRIM